MKTKFLIIATAILFLGCAPTGRYYWGKYSTSQYLLMKNANDAARKDHKAELLKIMLTSKQRSKPIPPGICAEYGYMMLNEGDYSVASSYFNAEVENYPESAPLIKLILKRIDDLKKEKENTETPKEVK
jgi:hypothetical protein